MKYINSILLLLIAAILVVSCHKSALDIPTPAEDDTSYEAITGDASAETMSAILSGSVKTNASSVSGLTAGIIYATSTSLQGGTELKADSFDSSFRFSVTAQNLSAGTTYSYAAYIIREGSYSYGEIRSFTTASIPVSVISLDAATLMLSLSGGPIHLTATVEPANATLPVLTWSSSTPSVATVSDGEVTPVSVGKTIVTVSAGAVSASCEVTVSDYAAVDLGLSVKWADMNVGALSEEETGSFFAWGETTPKDSYTWSNYVWGPSASGPFSRYNTSEKYGPVDDRVTLLSEDDAASEIWGDPWRMPTLNEADELRKSCIWSWDAERKGYTITGPSGKSIFLPAAGSRLGESHYEKGACGYYWTNSLKQDSPDYAFMLWFNSDKKAWDSRNRLYGLTIRPVCN